MILTQKVVAKLDERINRIQGALNYGEKYWNEELRNEAEEELRYLRALRRQVKKHTAITLEYTEDSNGKPVTLCPVCDLKYPCTFIKEVATDLGIEIEE